MRRHHLSPARRAAAAASGPEQPLRTMTGRAWPVVRYCSDNPRKFWIAFGGVVAALVAMSPNTHQPRVVGLHPGIVVEEKENNCFKRVWSSRCMGTSQFVPHGKKNVTMDEEAKETLDRASGTLDTLKFKLAAWQAHRAEKSANCPYKRRPPSE